MNLLPRISLNLLRRYYTKNKQQRTFEALVVDLLYSPWKTLSPARHESQRQTFSSGLRTFQLPSKQFNHRIITMMNTRIMNSMSSIIHNISPLLWFLFQLEFISSAWLSFKWSFIVALSDPPQNTQVINNNRSLTRGKIRRFLHKTRLKFTWTNYVMRWVVETPVN